MFARKLLHLYLLLSAILAVEAGRLFQLQVLSAEEDYQGRARSKLYSSELVDAMRGPILERNGEILARDRPRLDLMMDYERLSEPDRWLEQVRMAAGLDRRELLQRADDVIERVQRIRDHVEPRHRPIREETIPHLIVPGVGLGCAARVESQPERFEGCHIRVTRARVYPGGGLACHAIGHLRKYREGSPPSPAAEEYDAFRAYRPGDLIGEGGVEQQYEQYLRGTRGQRIYRIDLDTGLREVVRDQPARPGHAVWLTLDRRVQAAAEGALDGRPGAFVMMDVRTGGVIAVASSPGYDLNEYHTTLPRMLDDERSPLLNRAIQDPVSLGSVMKVAVALGALHEGVISEDTHFQCQGVLRLGGIEFTCPERYAHGRLSVREAIEHSCNIFFFKTGRSLGVHALVRWARRLGLGVKTGIDLPYEWSGRVPDPPWKRRRFGTAWYPGDTLNLSIGQGEIKITPVQVAVMMATVANGGEVPAPHVLLKVVNEGGELVAGGKAEVRRRLDLDPHHLAAVKEGMRRVPVTGTARYVQGLERYRVAGKTGTADIGNTGLNNAWFAGFAPHDEPEVSFAAVVHRTEQHGASGAGPVAAAALEAYFEPAAEIGPGQAEPDSTRNTANAPRAEAPPGSRH